MRSSTRNSSNVKWSEAIADQLSAVAVALPSITFPLIYHLEGAHDGPMSRMYPTDTNTELDGD